MHESNWSKWSSIAEIVSSIAIVITLFYLAVQTQQNNGLMATQNRYNYLQVANGSADLVANSEQLSSLLSVVNNSEREINNA